jgi:hypothetical protein
VGGLEACTFDSTLGVFRSRALKADRMSAFPIGFVKDIAKWADDQAAQMKEIGLESINLWFLADYVSGLAGTTEILPCAYTEDGGLDSNQLAEWLVDRPIVHLIATAELWYFPHGSEWGFYDHDRRLVKLPDSGLLVDLYPLWLIPDEIQPRRKDERFADVVGELDEDHPQSWWYQRGNFGPVSRAV